MCRSYVVCSCISFIGCYANRNSLLSLLSPVLVENKGAQTSVVGSSSTDGGRKTSKTGT